MSRNRFVTPETVRIELSDDDWIEVKSRLAFGEQQAMNSAGVTQMTGARADATADDLGLGLDMARWVVERIAVWLTDWSFRDADDKPVRLTRAAIKALDTETAAEIQAALDAHVRAIEEKKATLIPNGRTPTGTP